MTKEIINIAIEIDAPSSAEKFGIPERVAKFSHGDNNKEIELISFLPSGVEIKNRDSNNETCRSITYSSYVEEAVKLLKIAIEESKRYGININI